MASLRPTSKQLIVAGAVGAVALGAAFYAWARKRFAVAVTDHHGGELVAAVLRSHGAWASARPPARK